MENPTRENLTVFSKVTYAFIFQLANLTSKNLTNTKKYIKQVYKKLFIEALLVIAKVWKYPSFLCRKMGELVWYTYTVENYTSINKE